MRNKEGKEGFLPPPPLNGLMAKKKQNWSKKQGFGIEDSKFVKSREIIGFINFSEL